VRAGSASRIAYGSSVGGCGKRARPTSLTCTPRTSRKDTGTVCGSGQVCMQVQVSLRGRYVGNEPVSLEREARHWNTISLSERGS
jgi:hypothetical protein